MNYRAVIFDLDGTLLDTLADIADSTNTALRSLGFPPHPVDTYKRYIGDGREALALRALPESKRDRETIASLTIRITEHYSRRWADKTRPYPLIPEMLNRLAACHMKMAILTNKPQDFTEKLTARFLSDWQFDAVVGASPATPKKPDPTSAVEIASKIKIPPSEFIFLGDSNVDMKTAVAAVMYPVGALWGFRNADELLSSGAKVLLKIPTDVLKLL